MSARLLDRRAAYVAGALWSVLTIGCRDTSAPRATPKDFTHADSTSAGSTRQLIKLAGDAQTGIAATVLPQQLTVRAEDGNGNAIPDVKVRWRLHSLSDALLDLVCRESTLSDQNVTQLDTLMDQSGSTSVSWKIPSWVSSAADCVVEALFPDSSAVAVFTATVLPGPPARLSLFGDDQRALQGEAVGTDPLFQVLDEHSNYVPDAEVNWSVIAGGGTIAPAATHANSAGVGTVHWTLGSAGAQEVVASAGAASAHLHAVALADAQILANVFTGDSWSCGLNTTGNAVCWGDNASKQLGTDDQQSLCSALACRTEPVRAVATTAFSQLALAHDLSCGLALDATAFCWGRVDHDW